MVIVQTATLPMAIRQTATAQTATQTRMPIRHRHLSKICAAQVLVKKSKREFFSFLQLERILALIFIEYFQYDGENKTGYIADIKIYTNYFIRRSIKICENVYFSA